MGLEESINYILSLKAQIESMGKYCCLSSGTDKKIGLYCNGFFIQYNNSGSYYSVKSIKGAICKNIYGVENVCKYIFFDFIDLSYPILSPIIECIPQKGFLSKYLIAREIKESVRKIGNRFSLNDNQIKEVNKIIKDNRDKGRTKIAMEIVRQMSIGASFQKIESAVSKCKELLKNIPIECSVSVPLSFDEELAPGMTVVDLILLSIFISHPYILWISHCRIKEDKIINQSHYPYLIGRGFIPECKGKFIPSSFWEDISMRKNELAIQLMNFFTSKNKYPFSGSNKNIHILHQIATCYKIDIPNSNRVRLNDAFIKSLLYRTSQNSLVNEPKRIDGRVS